MNIRYNVGGNEEINTTTKKLIDGLVNQAANIGDIGDIDLFGEPSTALDVAHSIRELSRVAMIVADAIEKAS